jgi:hypothetical protein
MNGGQPLSFHDQAHKPPRKKGPQSQSQRWIAADGLCYLATSGFRILVLREQARQVKRNDRAKLQVGTDLDATRRGRARSQLTFKKNTI